MHVASLQAALVCSDGRSLAGGLCLTVLAVDLLVRMCWLHTALVLHKPLAGSQFRIGCIHLRCLWSRRLCLLLLC